MNWRNEPDAGWLRHTFRSASRNVADGGQPFAAVLIGPTNELLLETVNTKGWELIGHAETNLVRAAAVALPRSELEVCSLYSSTEPCLMCAGAIGWSGVGTVVFGLSQNRMKKEGQGTIPPRFQESFTLQSLLASLDPPVVIRGPLLEEEALQPHLEYLVAIGSRPTAR